MKRWRWVPFFALSSVLAESAGASAQETIDVSKITCNQFVTGKVADYITVSVWLNGYYHGIHNSTLLDVSAAQKNSDALVDYCLSHPSVTLLNAVPTLFEKKN